MQQSGLFQTVASDVERIQPPATPPTKPTPSTPTKPSPTQRPFSDPRPDLAEDRPRWETLLRLAYIADKPGLLFGLLHGLRCGGARLTVQGNQWKLDYKPGLAELAAEQATKWEQFLFSQKDRLFAWLQEAAALYEGIGDKAPGFKAESGVS